MTVRCRHLLLATIVLAAAPVQAGGLAVIGTQIADNGDGDGLADTRETVQLSLSVRNTSGTDLTGLTLWLQPQDGSRLCLTTGEVVVGALAAGETKLTAPFVFTVANLDRATLGLAPLDPLTIDFELFVTSALPAAPRVVTPWIVLDLDLDVSGGSGATTFFETFEPGTLGTFENDNIDAGKFGLAASDGYRCPYSDPDWVHSNIYGSAFAPTCHLGVSAAQADAVYWGLSGPLFSPFGGRAFTGFHSLFFGVDLGDPEPGNFTTPLSVLEAVRSAQPIHLGWQGAPPVLSIKHQMSFADNRCAPPLADGHTYDRGVVMAQLADPGGAPVGPWIKLYPHENPYDQQNGPFTINCSFDPVDDGNTEDDFFDPADPNRRYGPSSTCWPEYAFADMGETSTFYDPGNVGGADGPGLAGQWGIGTWIESKFDLGRFRGRSVRLRFLAAGTQTAGGAFTWEDAFNFNPEPCDDGWWIDDVTVVNTLTTPAALSADAKDNSGLPGPPTDDADSDGLFDVCDNCLLMGNPGQGDEDRDGLGDSCDPCPVGGLPEDDFDADGICLDDNCPYASNPYQEDGDDDSSGTACDCDDDNTFVYPGAPERNDGIDNQCPGDPGHGVIDEVSGLAGFYDPADKLRFSWPAQVGAFDYQIAVASKPDYSAGCTKVDLPNFQLYYSVTGVLPPGQIRYYLARAVAPNVGSWGQRSSGQARVVPCAP